MVSVILGAAALSTAIAGGYGLYRLYTRSTTTTATVNETRVDDSGTGTGAELTPSTHTQELSATSHHAGKQTGEVFASPDDTIPVRPEESDSHSVVDQALAGEVFANPVDVISVCLEETDSHGVVHQALARGPPCPVRSPPTVAAKPKARQRQPKSTKEVPPSVSPKPPPGGASPNTVPLSMAFSNELKAKLRNRSEGKVDEQDGHESTSTLNGGVQVAEGAISFEEVWQVSTSTNTHPHRTMHTNVHKHAHKHTAYTDTCFEVTLT